MNDGDNASMDACHLISGEMPIARSILDALPAHVAVLDSAGIIILVNQHWVQFAVENDPANWDLLREGADYLAACRKAADMGDSLAREALSGIEAVLAGRARSFSQEYPCHSPTTKRWFKMDVNARGVSGGAVVAHLDITHRYQAQQALLLSQANLREAQDIARMGRWEIDLVTDHLEWSDSVFNIFEIEPHSFGGCSRSFLELVHPEDRQWVEDAFRASLDNKGSYKIEHRIVLKGGRVKWVQEIGRNEFSDTGKPVRCVGIVQDITERKLAEQQLRQSRQMLQAVLDTIPVRVFWKDRNSVFLGCNQPFALDAGLSSPEQLIGKDDCQMTWGDQAENYRRDDREVMESGVAKVNYEEPQTTPDGRRIWLRTSKIPLMDTEGRIQGVLGVYEDITEQKRAQDEIKQSEESLRRSNYDLEQFAYIASHDLQEPLRMVIAYMNLLQSRYQGRLDSQADEYIGFAVDGANRMHQLISDLLTYSRATARGMLTERVSVQAVLDTAIANLQVMIVESCAKITHDPLPEVMANKTQITQLLMNLLSNSIKFRGPDPPQIHLSARQEGDKLVFSVRDNGIGMDSSSFEKIFQVFKRLHGHDKYPGSGIGLAICKRIVENHGGSIWLESQRGHGTTFFFTLPAA
jgi:PAS domain S-box-containing protein